MKNFIQFQKKFGSLLFMAGAFLFFGCEKESSGSKAEASFAVGNHYKVLSPNSIEAEGELILTTEGTFTAHGHIWSETNQNPAFTEGHAPLGDPHTDLGEIAASGKFTSFIGGLEYGKLYYYRSYARVGNDKIFYGYVYKASTAWQPGEGPGKALRDGISMVIGDKAYLGLGSDSYTTPVFNDIHSNSVEAGNVSSLWVFDANANHWSDRNPFPGGGREESFSFVLNGKGYVGGGFSGEFLTFPNYSITRSDLWEYDPAADQWTQKGDLPPNLHRIGFVLEGQAYCFNQSEFYRYNPEADEWIPLPFGFESRIWTTSFVVNGKAYLVGGVTLAQEILAEVLEFDPASQAWTKKADFPGGRRAEAVSFVIDNEAYVGTGLQSLDNLLTTNDFWKYDAGNDTWEPIGSIPVERQGGLAFSIGNRAFVGLGGNEYLVNDLWEYMPE